MSAESPARLRLVLAYACIWLVWGSTFLAIRYAVMEIPPLALAGVRFLIAGVALGAWAFAGERLAGRSGIPTRREVVTGFGIGAVLFLGNGRSAGRRRARRRASSP